ncbi:hypothetical protein Fcan01_22871 [Folsomia candida]|uniref:Uncharacterized protein n=1 Tax=Folsomia candida TaxID=158441 RepID=A0A226DB38_FOLCA|nr:hypothetical protein Fcan01_22871 [Folsomia candida]
MFAQSNFQFSKEISKYFTGFAQCHIHLTLHLQDFVATAAYTVARFETEISNTTDTSDIKLAFPISMIRFPACFLYIHAGLVRPETGNIDLAIVQVEHPTYHTNDQEAWPISLLYPAQIFFLLLTHPTEYIHEFRASYISLFSAERFVVRLIYEGVDVSSGNSSASTKHRSRTFTLSRTCKNDVVECANPPYRLQNDEMDFISCNVQTIDDYQVASSKKGVQEMQLLSKSDSQLVETFPGFVSFAKKTAPNLWRISNDDFMMERGDALMSRIAPFLSVNPLSIVSTPDETEWRNIFFVLVLNILLKTTNSTYNATESSETIIIGKNQGTVVCDQDMRTLPNSEGSVLVPLRFEGFNFITCHEDDEISFAFYAQPFQENLWIGLTLWVAGLTVLFKLYGNFVLKCDSSIVAWAMAMFSSLLEQPAIVRKGFEVDKVFRVVFGLWTLLVTVFTNGYKGLAVNDVVAPLASWSPEYFRNLSSQTYSCYPFDEGCKDGKKINMTSLKWLDSKNLGSDFRLYSEMEYFDIFSYPNKVTSLYIYRIARVIYGPITADSFAQKYGITMIRLPATHDDLTLYRLASPVHVLHPPGYKDILESRPKNWSLAHGLAVEKEVTKCNQVAFTDFESVTKREVSHLRKYLKFEGTWVGWVFNSHGNYEVITALKWLVESGIYELLRIKFDYDAYRGRRKASREIIKGKWLDVGRKAVGIGDSIQTIFYIWLILLCFGDLPRLPLAMKTKAVKTFIYLLEVAIFLYPILVFLLLQFIPRTPPFILSMFQRFGPSGGEEFGYKVTLGVHLFETWMTFHFMYSGTTWFLYVFVGIAFLLNYFQLLNREILKTENHNDVTACIWLYRYVQVLEKSFNAFVSEKLVPTIKFCLPALQIFALYVWITLHATIALPGFAIFPLLAINAGISNILVITLASIVNISSEGVLNALGQKVVGCQGGKRALIRREVEACGVLKVKFGSNFIDRGTPLVMQNFCITQTVSLCLVKARKFIT